MERRIHLPLLSWPRLTWVGFLRLVGFLSLHTKSKFHCPPFHTPYDWTLPSPLANFLVSLALSSGLGPQDPVNPPLCLSCKARDQSNPLPAQIHLFLLWIPMAFIVNTRRFTEPLNYILSGTASDYFLHFSLASWGDMEPQWGRNHTLYILIVSIGHIIIRVAIY